jgi:hypothetical protein
MAHDRRMPNDDVVYIADVAEHWERLDTELVAFGSELV